MTAIFAVVLSLACGSPCDRDRVETQLTVLSAAVRSADYRGDRAALERLEQQLAKVPDSSLDEYRAYWRGFARWRRALNGFNENPQPADVESDVRAAIDQFKTALAKRPNWIEARLALVGCSGNASTASGGGGHAATGASSSSSGTMCGAEICTPDQVCAVPVGACNGPKSCQPGPSCDQQNVACGCDGKNYATQCFADIMGGGVASAGACAPPANHFTCRYQDQLPVYCMLGAEYCQITAMAHGDYLEECKPEPASCGAAPTDCSCLTGACGACTADMTNHSLSVFCM